MADDPRFEKFDAAKAALDKSTTPKGSSIHTEIGGAASGMRTGIELVTGPMAGGLIGWGLDKWLGTTPFFLVALLILGVITGFYNVWRLTNGKGTAVGIINNDNPDHAPLREKDK